MRMGGVKRESRGRRVVVRGVGFENFLRFFRAGEVFGGCRD